MSDDDVRDDAQEGETVIEAAEGSPDAETDFHPFDEVDEDFQPAPAVFVKGADGLPLRLDQTTESDIPALSLKTLICMGDFSKFVTRDEWGDVIAEFLPAQVQRAPDGRFRVTTEIARECGATNLRNGWIEVEPIRPQCQHYVRQQGSFHLNAANRKHYRLCSARRTTEGTFMTVSDLGMWACDMRSPYDVESVKVLDDFDKLKIEQGSKREYLSIFEGRNNPPDPLKENT